jgi:hypothetical protein
MENLLQFSELKEGKLYRLLHGGQKDHGYNYILKNGKLFNRTKNRDSSLSFNQSIRFIETENKFLNLDSLDYEVEFHSKGMKVGCQNLVIDDALILANEIINRYYVGENG